ncbi:MAG: replicative DNA helicase [Christensenellaceae bacterium]|jgi:replicative DNA helicase
MAEIVGRVPPHSQEAEQSILGAMLLSEDCVLAAVEKLKEEDFYTTGHRRLWRVMEDLATYHKPVDLVTVSGALNEGGSVSAEELAYLSGLTEAVPSLRNIDSYIEIVAEKSRLRKLITATAEIADMAYMQEFPANEIINSATDLIYKVANDGGERSLVHVRQALVEGYESIAKAASSKDGLMGVPTGFPLLDKKLSGLQPAQLVVVAARPGMGKTSFALNVMEHMAVKESKPVALFSLEMSREQLGTRLLCTTAGIDSQDARTGKLSSQQFIQIADAMEPLESAPIYIDDTAVIGPGEIMAKTRRLKNQVGELGLVVIDYLQLMTAGTRVENRQQEISSITRFLKVAAKELNVPIMLLSQLSRATEKRESKRPMLSDLRESGAIEQDADVVLFLHREDYYDPNAEPGKANIIIAKQRSGPTGTIDVLWRGEQTKYQEIAFMEE